MKILIVATLDLLSKEELETIVANIEKFSDDNVKIKETKDIRLVEAIADSGLIALKDGEIEYLTAPVNSKEETKITVVRNEAKKTVKLYLNNSWLDFDLDGKNSHIQRIRGMRINAKSIGYDKGEMKDLQLSEYSEENDVSLYIQERYVIAWSEKAVISKKAQDNTDVIRNMTGDMRLLLDRATKEFLEYRRNGLSISKEETEKKK